MMNALSLFKVQWKIIVRYSEMLMGTIFFYLSAGLFFVMVNRLYPDIEWNIPLFCIAFTILFTGGCFGNLFCEKEGEIKGYLLFPWSLRMVIISKNAALCFLSIMIPLPAMFFLSFFYDYSWQQSVNAVLYLISTLSLCLVLGNQISTSQTRLLFPERVLFAEWMIVLISPIPYLVFQNWLNSAVLLLCFSLLTIVLWYLYELPRIEQKFRTRLYNAS